MEDIINFKREKITGNLAKTTKFVDILNSGYMREKKNAWLYNFAFNLIYRME